MELKEFRSDAITYYSAGKGPVIVFLHGFCLSSEIWYPLIKNLIDSYKCILIDLPGLGKSLSPNSFTMDNIARVIWNVLDNSGIKNAVIAGHSMGGYIACEMAVQKPENCEGLILVHSHFKGDSTDKKEARQKNAAFVKKYGSEVWLHPFYQSLFFREESREQYVPKFAPHISPEIIIGYTLSMANRKDRSLDIEKAIFPVSIISGKNDPHIPESIALQCASAAPVTFYHSLSDCGHMGMLEYPEKISAHFKQFLQFTMPE